MNDKYLDGHITPVNYWGKLPPLVFLGVEDGDIDCIGRASIAGSVKYAFARYSNDIQISEDDFFKKYNSISSYENLLSLLCEYFELRNTGIERITHAIASEREFK